MVHRHAHYWLCCTGFNTPEIIAELGGINARVQTAARPTSKFGPYDYIFIDASEEDASVDRLLELLVEKLEPHEQAISKWGCNLTSGVKVTVCTNEGKHIELVSSEVLGRLSRLNLQVSFVYESVSPTSA